MIMQEKFERLETGLFLPGQNSHLKRKSTLTGKVYAAKRNCCGCYNDTFDQLLIVFFQLIELFKLLMGTMLVVIVPQSCDQETLRECSFTERLDYPNLSTLNQIALAFNMTALVFTVGHKFLVVRREVFLRKSFELIGGLSTIDVSPSLDRGQFSRSASIFHDFCTAFKGGCLRDALGEHLGYL